MREPQDIEAIRVALKTPGGLELFSVIDAKILDLDMEYIMCPNCECKIDMPTTGETK